MNAEQLEVRHDPASGRFLPKGDAGGDPLHGGEEPPGPVPDVGNGPPDVGGPPPHSGREGPPESYPESAAPPNSGDGIDIVSAADGDDTAGAAIVDAVRGNIESVVGASSGAAVEVNPEPGVDGAPAVHVTADDPQVGWSASGHYGPGVDAPYVEVSFDSSSLDETAAQDLGRVVNEALGVPDADVSVSDGYQVPAAEDRASYPPNPHMGPFLSIEDRADRALARLGTPSRRFRARAGLARLGAVRSGVGRFARHPRP